jgi:hypothetical protein
VKKATKVRPCLKCHCGKPKTAQAHECVHCFFDAAYAKRDKPALTPANPYLRPIRVTMIDGVPHVDVYAVLMAFPTGSPALDNAAKKILCAGQRGHKDRITDLREAYDAIERAMELETTN